MPPSKVPETSIVSETSSFPLLSGHATQPAVELTGVGGGSLSSASGLVPGLKGKPELGASAGWTGVAGGLTLLGRGAAAGCMGAELPNGAGEPEKGRPSASLPPQPASRHSALSAKAPSPRRAPVKHCDSDQLKIEADATGFACSEPEHISSWNGSRHRRYFYVVALQCANVLRPIIRSCPASNTLGVTRSWQRARAPIWPPPVPVQPFRETR